MNDIIDFFTNLDFEKFMTMLNTGVIGSVLTFLGASWVKLSRFKATAPTQIKDELMQKLPLQVNTSVESAVKKEIANYFAPIANKITQIEQGQRIIAESLVLTNSADPASKLALLENVSKINAINNTYIAQVQQEVKEQVALEEQKEIAKEEIVAEIEKEISVDTETEIKSL